MSDYKYPNLIDTQEIKAALAKLQPLFEQAQEIVDGLSVQSKEFLIDFHSENTNLVHLARWGNNIECYPNF